jgi:hypothetical protein
LQSMHEEVYSGSNWQFLYFFLIIASLLDNPPAVLKYIQDSQFTVLLFD